MPNKHEIRMTVGELRATKGTNDSPPSISGYAALFGVYSQDLGGFKEKIKPGTFSRAITEKQDVRCLFNHSADVVIGRVKSGTLTIKEDERGLFFNCVLPDTQAARDMHTSVSRGDLDQCSFAFSPTQGGETWGVDKDENGEYFAARTLTDVDLFDCSIVTYPAYTETSCQARSKERRWADVVPVEVRAKIEDEEKKSWEEFLALIGAAIRAKYGCNSWGWQKYSVLDTYDDYCVVVDNESIDPEKCLSKLTYSIDKANVVTLGDLEPVEVQFVLSERATKRQLETRTAFQAAEKREKDPDNDGDDDSELVGHLADAHIACTEAAAAALAAKKDLAGEALAAFCTKAKAAVTALQSACESAEEEQGKDNRAAADKTEKRDAANDMPDKPSSDDELVDEEGEFDCMSLGDSAFESDHIDGDCENVNCRCQNVMRNMEDARAGKKVRTKQVGDKNLTYHSFAYVGDKNKTETWKLPIHDVTHVRNALARFSETQGIPASEKKAVYAKIVAAAHKFGIEVSEKNSLRALEGTAMDEDEVNRLRWQLYKDTL